MHIVHCLHDISYICMTVFIVSCHIICDTQALVMKLSFFLLLFCYHFIVSINFHIQISVSIFVVLRHNCMLILSISCTSMLFCIFYQSRNITQKSSELKYLLFCICRWKHFHFSIWIEDPFQDCWVLPRS